MADQTPEQEPRHGFVIDLPLVLLLLLLQYGFWLIPIIVGIVFVILKLTQVVAWSWLWVAAPFWLGIPIAVLLYLIGKKLSD